MDGRALRSPAHPATSTKGMGYAVAMGSSAAARRCAALGADGSVSSTFRLPRRRMVTLGLPRLASIASRACGDHEVPTRDPRPPSGHVGAGGARPAGRRCARRWRSRSERGTRRRRGWRAWFGLPGPRAVLGTRRAKRSPPPSGSTRSDFHHASLGGSPAASPTHATES